MEAREEIEDLAMEHETEREELLDSIRNQNKELQLWEQVRRLMVVGHPPVWTHRRCFRAISNQRGHRSACSALHHSQTLLDGRATASTRKNICGANRDMC